MAGAGGGEGEAEQESEEPVEQAHGRYYGRSGTRCGGDPARAGRGNSTRRELWWAPAPDG